MGKSKEIIQRDPCSGGSVPALRHPTDCNGEICQGFQWLTVPRSKMSVKCKKKTELCGLGCWKKLTWKKQGDLSQFGTRYSSQMDILLFSLDIHFKKQWRFWTADNKDRKTQRDLCPLSDSIEDSQMAFNCIHLRGYDNAVNNWVLRLCTESTVRENIREQWDETEQSKT